MQYKVISYFTDLQDNEHEYHEGDVFPRGGFSVSDERIAELSSSQNRQHKPLIKKIEDSAMRYTKTDVIRMSTDCLRQVAASAGIEDAENMTGKELKERLISVLKL